MEGPSEISIPRKTLHVIKVIEEIEHTDTRGHDRVYNFPVIRTYCVSLLELINY